MIGWGVTAVYVIGFLWSTWFFGGLFAYETGYRPDIMFGLFMGAMVALVWPVALPGRLLYERNAFGRSGARLVRVPPRMRERELERERREQEDRIRELERQVGVR